MIRTVIMTRIRGETKENPVPRMKMMTKRVLTNTRNARLKMITVGVAISDVTPIPSIEIIEKEDIIENDNDDDLSVGEDSEKKTKEDIETFTIITLGIHGFFY